MVENGQVVVRPMNYLAHVLRPPHHRRPRGRAVAGRDEGSAGGSGAAAARHLRRWPHGNAIRRRRHRRRPRRLHRRDPRRAARLQRPRASTTGRTPKGKPGARAAPAPTSAASRRRRCCSRRRTTSTPATRSPTTASRSTGLTIDVAKMLARKDKVVEAEQRRHPVPVQEEQGRVLPRPRRVRRQATATAGRSTVDGAKPETIVAQARHRRHRLEAARAARRAVRRRAHPRQRRRARDRRRAEAARRHRRGRDRPRDGQRVAPARRRR